MKDEIILKNLWLIPKIIKELNCNYRNLDEYESYYYAGLIGLIEAVENYDNSKSKLNYLINGIKFGIKREFYKNSMKKRITTIPISLNEKIYEVELQDLIASNYNLEEEIIRKLYIEKLLSKLKDKRYKQFIIEYYGIGCPQLNMREIAEKYGVCVQNVQQAIQRGLRYLRKEIE